MASSLFRRASIVIFSRSLIRFEPLNRHPRLLFWENNNPVATDRPTDSVLLCCNRPNNSNARRRQLIVVVASGHWLIDWLINSTETTTTTAMATKERAMDRGSRVQRDSFFLFLFILLKEKKREWVKAIGISRRGEEIHQWTGDWTGAEASERATVFPFVTRLSLVLAACA